MCIEVVEALVLPDRSIEKLVGVTSGVPLCLCDFELIQHRLQRLNTYVMSKSIEMPACFINDKSHGLPWAPHTGERSNIKLELIEETARPRSDATSFGKGKSLRS